LKWQLAASQRCSPSRRSSRWPRRYGGDQPLSPAGDGAAENRAAQRTAALLARTDRLLGVILLGNNLVNSAASVLTGVIAIDLLGQSELALALATGAITFLIVVFSEITPKVVGATFPEKIALPFGRPRPLLVLPGSVG
jgi:Mg2+/Co2+ transporter CorB